MRNLGQTKCKRCRQWHGHCADMCCVPDEKWSELKDYAAEHGRTWKMSLRNAWSAGEDPIPWARQLWSAIELDKVQLYARRFER